MKKTALFLWLAAAVTARAAVPRVSVDAPLEVGPTPAVSAGASAPTLTFSAAIAPSLTAVAAPSLAAPPGVAPRPLAMQSLKPALMPAAQPLFAPALTDLALPEAPLRAAGASGPEAPAPKTIDSLRENAPLSAKLGGGALEDAAPALEKNFAAAASLAEGKGGDGSVKGDGSASPASADLTKRFFEKVALDGGSPEGTKALRQAFERMLASPSAREFAERFLAEGVPAVVRFEEFPGSRLVNANGRMLFYAARGYTEWKGDHVLVRMNRDYLGTDDEYRREDLPPTLAHELLGHGTWYARAAKAGLTQAFHHHDLNETNARLVGWITDFELDRRFEESGAWGYLADPIAFLHRLKLRLPYYALTFSTAEMAKAQASLEARSADAKMRRAQLVVELSNHNSWIPVIDHFANKHGIEESRLRALRGYMNDTAQNYRDEIAMVDALVAEVEATIGRMKAEPSGESEIFLRNASANPMFVELQREADRNTRILLDQIAAAGAQPGGESDETRRAREEHWRGQITYQDLVEMYRKDRADNPKHWGQ